ncbi:MAG: ribosome silencing factor [Ruminococcus sp.]|nr:ribosome silencing factor [Ruminococcus sp.]MBQ8906662.1 ribosome silencing factor [Ruminococcus sp.]
MTTQEKLEIIVRALDMKRGEDIAAIKISDLTIIADYFVIVHGTSNTHVKTLADETEFKLSQAGVEPLRSEGYQSASWIVLDYGDIVVHVFMRDAREQYQLERLWADGEQTDISAYLTKD